MILKARHTLWNGPPDEVSEDPWDLATFVRDRLEDWIELFAGMEA